MVRLGKRQRAIEVKISQGALRRDEKKARVAIVQ